MQDPRQRVFLFSLAAAIVLAIVGILYLAGIGLAPGLHPLRAVASFAAAALAAGMAAVSRPGRTPRS